MKVCWDNLERFTYVGNGEFTIDNISKRYIIKNCKTCNNETLVAKCDYKKGYGKYCDSKCMGKDIDFRNNLSKKRIGGRNPFYGKTHTEETKKKISLPGNLNPNWQGGISYGEYCSIWSDKEYKKSIKERDENKCQSPLCKGNYKKLDIHHIDYNKKNCHPFNLILICTRCNAIANFNREWWTCFYTEIIRRKMKMIGERKNAI